MNRRLLIGLGNPLAGDDGFGPAVVSRLVQQGLGPDVEVVPQCIDLLGQIDTFAAYQAVVLVDAVLGGGAPPGTVATVQESTHLRWEARSTSAHRLAPGEALRVFRALAPEATTRISLVALHTGELGGQPVQTDSPAVEAGMRLVRVLLP